MTLKSRISAEATGNFRILQERAARYAAVVLLWLKVRMYSGWSMESDGATVVVASQQGAKQEEEEFYMLLSYHENRQVVVSESPLVQQLNHR